MAYVSMERIDKLSDLCSKPSTEQIPRGFPKMFWKPLFNGFADDAGRTPDQWASKLRATYEKAALDAFAKDGVTADYEAHKAADLRLVLLKFENAPCCTCPLGEVRDKQVLFDRVCLLWFSLCSLTDSGAERVTEALQNALV
jgi:hypothetical protein